MQHTQGFSSRAQDAVEINQLREEFRRNRGTYGPAVQAGSDTFPGHSTPIAQLYCCGDSTFPGIGVPAVAASGAIVANSLVSVSQHSKLLDAIGI